MQKGDWFIYIKFREGTGKSSQLVTEGINYKSDRINKKRILFFSKGGENSVNSVIVSPKADKPRQNRKVNSDTKVTLKKIVSRIIKIVSRKRTPAQQGLRKVVTLMTLMTLNIILL